MTEISFLRDSRTEYVERVFADDNLIGLLELPSRPWHRIKAVPVALASRIEIGALDFTSKAAAILYLRAFAVEAGLIQG